MEPTVASETSEAKKRKLDEINSIPILTGVQQANESTSLQTAKSWIASNMISIEEFLTMKMSDEKGIGIGLMLLSCSMSYKKSELRRFCMGFPGYICKFHDSTSVLSKMTCSKSKYALSEDDILEMIIWYRFQGQCDRIVLINKEIMLVTPRVQCAKNGEVRIASRKIVDPEIPVTIIKEVVQILNLLSEGSTASCMSTGINTLTAVKIKGQPRHWIEFYGGCSTRVLLIERALTAPAYSQSADVAALILGTVSSSMTVQEKWDMALRLPPSSLERFLIYSRFEIPFIKVDDKSGLSRSLKGDSRLNTALVESLSDTCIVPTMSVGYSISAGDQLVSGAYEVHFSETDIPKLFRLIGRQWNQVNSFRSCSGKQLKDLVAAILASRGMLPVKNVDAPANDEESEGELVE